MELMRSRVNTCALGECNSAGAVLLAAGTGLRQAFPDSIVAIHGMGISRNPPAKYVELTQASYTAFWRRRTRLPGAWLPLPQGGLHFLTAQQALDYGVIDGIVVRPTRAKPGAAMNAAPPHQ
jgi:ATP-dependent protease ClpP protease subunit